MHWSPCFYNHGNFQLRYNVGNPVTCMCLSSVPIQLNGFLSRFGSTVYDRAAPLPVKGVFANMYGLQLDFTLSYLQLSLLKKFIVTKQVIIKLNREFNVLLSPLV